MSTNAANLKPKVMPIYLVRVDLLEASPDNVTEPNTRSIRHLEENMREVGMTENLIVCPMRGESLPTGLSEILPFTQINSGKWEIISGHDKCQAAKKLGITHVPCVIADWDVRTRRYQIVRMNSIRKPMGRAKMVNLITKLNKEQTEEIIKEQMMFTDPEELDRMIASVRATIPNDLRPQFDKKKDEIKSVDDLASVVTEMFSKAGSTLDRGFAVFSYGGHKHFYIQLDAALKDWMEGLTARAEMENRHISEVLKEAVGITENE